MTEHTPYGQGESISNTYANPVKHTKGSGEDAVAGVKVKQTIEWFISMEDLASEKINKEASIAKLQEDRTPDIADKQALITKIDGVLPSK